MFNPKKDLLPYGNRLQITVNLFGKKIMSSNRFFLKTFFNPKFIAKLHRAVTSEKM